MIDITPENFESEITQADRPVLVEFWAPWCGVCHTMKPMLESFAEREKERVKFAMLNAQNFPALANRFRVMALPTFLFFRSGEISGQHVGALRESELLKFAGIN